MRVDLYPSIKSKAVAFPLLPVGRALLLSPILCLFPPLRLFTNYSVSYVVSGSHSRRFGEDASTFRPVRSRGEALMSRVGSPLLILFVDIYFHIYHMIQLSFFSKAEARLDAFLLFRGPTVSLYTPKRKYHCAGCIKGHLMMVTLYHFAAGAGLRKLTRIERSL